MLYVATQGKVDRLARKQQMCLLEGVPRKLLRKRVFFILFSPSHTIEILTCFTAFSAPILTPLKWFYLCSLFVRFQTKELFNSIDLFIWCIVWSLNFG